MLLSSSCWKGTQQCPISALLVDDLEQRWEECESCREDAATGFLVETCVTLSLLETPEAFCHCIVYLLFVFRKWRGELFGNLGVWKKKHHSLP